MWLFSAVTDLVVWACILHAHPLQPFKVHPLTHKFCPALSLPPSQWRANLFLLVTGFGGNAFYCFRAGRNNLYWPMASSPARALTPHSDALNCSIRRPGPHPRWWCQLKNEEISKVLLNIVGKWVNNGSSCCGSSIHTLAHWLIPAWFRIGKER